MILKVLSGFVPQWRYFEFGGVAEFGSGLAGLALDLKATTRGVVIRWRCHKRSWPQISTDERP